MPGQIDLSQLPPPEILKDLDFEVLLKEIRDDFLERHPQAAETLDLESEPVTKLLETAAYRTMINRQEFQEDARSLLLAYATGKALDHIGVTYYHTKRLELQPAQPEADPPLEAVMESDEDYKRRCQLAMDAPSTAGSEYGYEYHALSAHEDVKDAKAKNQYAGIVRVSVLSRNGTGAASSELISTVKSALSAERTRPLNDQVDVRSAEIINYIVAASLQLREGPDPEVVRNAAEKAAQQYATERHALGETVVVDKLKSVMYVQGVERVILASPSQDIVCDKTQAPYCSALEVTTDG